MKLSLRRTIGWFVFAVVLITAVSQCSPIHSFNDFVDINIIFTVGKSLWKGKLVYRDLFEHKGPLMYFITAISYLFSHTTFIGVWLFEILAAFIFMVYADRILKLLNPDHKGYFLPVIFYLIYHAPSFVSGTAEEFCLPLLTYGLYIGILALKEERCPSFRESFFVGITSGIMFWIKYNMVGFYIGLLVTFVVISIRKKQMKDLVRSALGVLCGLCAISLPILIFFGINGALDDLFHVYFYDNINGYANRLDFLYQGYYALTGTINTIRRNPIGWGLILIGLLELILQKQNRSVLFLVCSTAFFLAWFIYCGGMQFAYYSFILLMYAIFAGSVEPHLSWKYAGVIPAVIAAGILVFSFPYQRLSVRPDVTTTSQYQITSVIEDPEASILTYNSFDQGFYTGRDFSPSVFHFCMTNCVLDESRDAQKQYIDEGEVDYILSEEELSWAEHYTLISEQSGWFVYHLYK